jgi:hypothetical protein
LSYLEYKGPVIADGASAASPAFGSYPKFGANSLTAQGNIRYALKTRTGMATHVKFEPPDLFDQVIAWQTSPSRMSQLASGDDGTSRTKSMLQCGATV